MNDKERGVGRSPAGRGVRPSIDDYLSAFIQAADAAYPGPGAVLHSGPSLRHVTFRFALEAAAAAVVIVGASAWLVSRISDLLSLLGEFLHFSLIARSAMQKDSNGRLVIIAILVFALGIFVGASVTLGLEVAKVRQIVIGQIEARPLPRGTALMANGLTRLVTRELSLSPAQTAKLSKSLLAHEKEIQAERLAVSQTIRSIAQSVYAEIEPDLSQAQKAKALAILNK